MNEKKEYKLPVPLVDAKENKQLNELTIRYSKLIEPNMVGKIGKKVANAVPKPIKNAGVKVKEAISQKELYEKCMGVVGEGFEIIEKQAAKMSISEKSIVNKVNTQIKDSQITELEEICLARGYEISKIVAKYKNKDLWLALAEGAGTGAFGFAGLPFNIVLSTFLFYRAVQSIAMHYGYDVKNDSGEMVIASQVFMSALSPSTEGSSEMGSLIGKIMIITETTVVKQASNKSWQIIAESCGLGLLATQIRALANNAAKKALSKAGKAGLENTLFKEIFEQLGKKLTRGALGKSMIGFGAVIGALFDTAQMNTVLEYADIFYNKRFIAEKEERINVLIGAEKDVVEIVMTEG